MKSLILVLFLSAASSAFGASHLKCGNSKISVNIIEKEGQNGTNTFISMNYVDSSDTLTGIFNSLSPSFQPDGKGFRHIKLNSTREGSAESFVGTFRVNPDEETTITIRGKYHLNGQALPVKASYICSDLM